MNSQKDISGSHHLNMKSESQNIQKTVVEMNDPDPCQATGCAMQNETLTVCVDHRCPHRWTREGREDRQRREEKDAKEKEGGKCL